MRKTIASILILSSLVIAAFAMCTIKPQWIMQTFPSGNPGAGNQVTFQVGLDHAAVGSQAVSVYADDPSQFSSLPSTVYVPNGQTSTTFQGTLANDASGGVTVAASANGQEVDYEVLISGSAQSTYP